VTIHEEPASAPVLDEVHGAVRACADPVAVARALRPLFEEHAAENERLGRLDDESVRALCRSGLLGLLLPRELGGIEADPTTYIDVIEELSYADGSVGWMTMATTFTIVGAATWLGPVAIDEMFRSGRGFCAAAQIGPNGIAERVPDGYRIRGQFHFGSGSQVASWFMGAFVVHDGGTPVVDEHGAPQIVWAFAPRERVYVDPASWDVQGLRATASHDFRFLDQVVHEDFVVVPPGARRRGGPQLDLGVSMGHVAFSLGVGTRILDELQALAARKRRVGRATLIDQPTFQRDFAMMRGSMEAARTYVHAVYDRWFADATAHGTASLQTRAEARLAACWGTRIAADVARFALEAAGTDGLRNHPENRLQRAFRDIAASAVHRHVDDNVLVEVSSVLLGVHRPSLQL
jgi:indole-3-acetate monooxygenase